MVRKKTCKQDVNSMQKCAGKENAPAQHKETDNYGWMEGSSRRLKLENYQTA